MFMETYVKYKICKKKNDECQIQSGGFLKGTSQGKEYSRYFYCTCFVYFRSDVKQIQQK